MNSAPHILVVDDDREIRELLARFLEGQGMRVTMARDGAELRRLWPSWPFDLIVLDLMMPGESGLDLAAYLRRQSTIPIIMLTAMGEPTDRVIGLELGADDYIAKPFNPRELVARIRAVLRRSADAAGGAPAETKFYDFAGWRLDRGRRRLINPQGADVALTSSEFDLLRALLERPNRVLTRDELLDALRGRDSMPFDRTIDVAISRLRRKLAQGGDQSELIKTVRSGGYALASDVKRV